MENLFYDCRSLTSINIMHFDTSEVTKMVSMFEKCSTLSTLNISTLHPNKCVIIQKLY